MSDIRPELHPFASAGDSWLRTGESGELGRSARGCNDGVDQRTAHASSLKSMEARDRRAAGRGHLVLEHTGMFARLAYHPGGAEHGLGRQERGHLARQAGANAAVRQGLDHQINESGPAPREPGDGVE